MGIHLALSVLIFVLVVVATLEFWRLKVLSDEREVAYARLRLGKELRGQASRLINEQAARVIRLGAILSKTRAVDADEFERVVGEMGIPRAFVAMALVGTDGVVRQAWSGMRGEGWSVGAELNKSPPWASPLSRLPADREPRIVRTERRDHGAEMWLLTPVVAEGNSGAYRGAMVARLNLSTALADWLAKDVPAGTDLDLLDHGVLLSHGRPIAAEDDRTDGEPIGVINRVLRMRVRAGEAQLAARTVLPPRAVLWVGFAMAFLLAGAVWLTLREQARTARDACRHLAAIESLTQHAGTISAAPGAGREALARLARSAMESLRLRVSVIGMVDERFEQIEVFAAAGSATRSGQKIYSLSELRATRQSLERHEIIVVPDWERHPTVNRKAMEGLGAHSGLFIPLIVEEKAIGLLFIGDEQPRKYTQTEQRLARALGSLAGVVLANLRLYEQKDAALVAQQEMSQRHEALYGISTEIYRSEDLEESLQRLADSAPAVMEVETCMVTLRTGKTESTVMAVTGNKAGIKGERHDTSNFNEGKVWQSGHVMVIEDGPADASLHPAFRHRLHVGSIIYLPLMGSGGGAIGTLLLIREQPGSFSAAQLELADVLAARASMAIETAKLHEDARRAAQTQQMLLRELNHRVKNNLASIVSLLSLDRPPMDGEALDWLNRLTDRIATMARTHELFLGGKDRIDLKTLVAQLLPALALIKPPGVRVESDLGGLDVELGTERAVSLAMVLNELCWNALEHGTPAENGVLRIRGQSLGDGRIVIEVEDEGRSGNGEAERGRGGEMVTGGVSQLRGMGLKLVEGLVTRELRGTFEVVTKSEGGTVARITIPLAEGESTRLSL
jgi:two-component sensor histidine kinase